MGKLNKALLKILSCPKCGKNLEEKKEKIACSNNHFYEIDNTVPTMVELDAYLEKEAEAREDKWEKGISSKALSSYEYNMKIFKKLDYWEETGEAAGLIPSKENYIVLDLGCGNGVSTSNIKGKLVVGLDLSQSQMVKAKTSFKDAEFVVGNAEKLPFKDEVFDLVVAVNLLHHVPNTDRCLKECWRVLKKEGKLLSVDPNLYNPIGFIGRGLYRFLRLDRIFPPFPQFALGREEKQFSKKAYYKLFERSPFIEYKVIPHRIERLLFFLTILLPFLIKIPGYEKLLVWTSRLGNRIVQIEPFDQICYFWIGEAKK